MSIKEYLFLALKVLKDFRVLGTVIAMILIIEFAKYVASYKKKPEKKGAKKAKAPKPAPAPKTEAPAENQGAQEAAEG